MNNSIQSHPLCFNDGQGEATWHEGKWRIAREGIEGEEIGYIYKSYEAFELARKNSNLRDILPIYMPEACDDGDQAMTYAEFKSDCMEEIKSYDDLKQLSEEALDQLTEDLLPGLFEIANWAAVPAQGLDFTEDINCFIAEHKAQG